MQLVVDANIVLSSLVAGNITDIIFSPELDLVAPELLFIEIKKHKEELKKRSRFSDEEIDLLLSLLEEKIRIIPLSEFISFIPEAEEILEEHIKDVPYVALALRLKCPIWSYEKLLKKVDKVQSLTTSEVAKLIK